MKTTTKFFPLMIALSLISMAGNVNAQGRGHQKDHERNRSGNDERKHHDNYRDRDDDRRDDKPRDRDYDHRHDRNYSYDRNQSREVHHVYHHRHDRYCNHAPVVVHHYQARPRYIYYRDYDVYYDFNRNVYITYSGRNWTVSTSLPFVLHRVDIGRAVRMEVDYDNDDFPTYLERSRPSYRRVFTGS